MSVISFAPIVAAIDEVTAELEDYNGPNQEGAEQLMDFLDGIRAEVVERCSSGQDASRGYIPTFELWDSGS